MIPRRSFLAAATAAASAPALLKSVHGGSQKQPLENTATGRRSGGGELHADLVITGSSLGGCAAALAALRNGLRVILTEETDWIGGQLTSQAVPPDEHRWIETHGANSSWRELRRRIRDYYRLFYPLMDSARQQEFLNPGNGSVSKLCHEPRVALHVLLNWFAPWLSSRKLILLTEHRIVHADVDADRVRAVTVSSVRSGDRVVLMAPWFIDATELGDLLPATGTEFVTGSEARSETGELHAAENADPDNQQAFTMCFAMDHVVDQNFVISKPDNYEFWRDFVPTMKPAWPGRLLSFTYTHPPTGVPRTLGFDPAGGRTSGIVNLWTYRRLIDRKNFQAGSYEGDISLVNWPQNDYFLGNLTGDSDETRQQHISQARQLSLSLLYWLQTEAPREDGGQGFPGLRLRPDIMGTEDGLAKYPYIRESRRIRAMFTVNETHVGRDQRAMISGQSGPELTAAEFADSVGVGSYAIDLHPSTAGDNYIDFASLPFQVPLGALIPQRVENLLAGCKNLGVTHITCGCYRLHPVEWGIGEAAGIVAAQALQTGMTPRAIRSNPEALSALQQRMLAQGVEIAWPKTSA